VAKTRQTVQVVRDASEEIPYSVPEATSATKLETPIMETPFSIEVVPNHVILDQQAIRLQDVTGIVTVCRPTLVMTISIKRLRFAALKPTSHYEMASGFQAALDAAAWTLPSGRRGSIEGVGCDDLWPARA
jgi:hypothetical protein